MASRYKMTETKIRAFQAQGRGTGRGASYRPWLTVQDLSSRGRVARFWSETASRQHHFFSDLEYALGLECDWNPIVVDLREQFPLDRADTIAIAQDIGVRHPRDGDCFPVMTTDLLLDLVVAGKRSQLAIAVKYVAELEDPKKGPRVLEKLELERRYWRRVGVPWTIMTEREIAKANSETLRRLAQHGRFEGLRALREGSWEDRASTVEAALPKARGSSIATFCLAIDKAEGWSQGDALAMVWHLCARRRVAFDIDAGLDPRGPLTQLTLVGRPLIELEAA